MQGAPTLSDLLLLPLRTRIKSMRASFGKEQIGVLCDNHNFSFLQRSTVSASMQTLLLAVLQLVRAEEDATGT